MSLNGRLPASDLAPIPGGRLRKDAAACWNEMDAECFRQTGRHLRPLGPLSSYRLYSTQVYFYHLYVTGHGNLAAYPGTSNHGWGTAVDLAQPWMRAWINAHGARYGWKKTEAFGEWWHVNFVGGHCQAKPRRRTTISKGYYAKDERAWANKLLYHRRAYHKEARTGKGAKYRAHYAWASHYRRKLEKRNARLTSLAHKVHSWKPHHRGARRAGLAYVISKATSGYLPPAK